MTASRLLTGAVAILALSACFPDRALEVRTISLDHLTGAQAAELSAPYLSKEGTVFRSKEMLNAITVRDHERNVERIRSMLSSRDASPASVALHFQLIRASETGTVGAGLERMADALDDLLRFRGYELLSEAVVSATERGTVEQSLDGGDMPVQLGVRISDVSGYEQDGSVEMEVELRRAGGQLLKTNVVVPVGQTIVLGSAYPGSNEKALILTVRGEMGSQTVRSASRRRSRGQEAAFEVEAVEAAKAAEEAVEAVKAAEAAVTEANIAAEAHGVHPRTKIIVGKNGSARAIAPATPVVVPPPAR
jgi:hypothetical protein